MISCMLRTAAIAIALFATGYSVRADEPAPRHVTVTGQADVKVEPDEVVIPLRIVSRASTIESAKTDNDKKVRRVMEAIREKGVEKKHIATDHINIEPRFKGKYEERIQVGFEVSCGLQITLRDLSVFEGLLTEVLNCGVTHVRDVDFRTTKLRECKDKARLLAMKAAREKAVDLAGALGQNVGRPLSIEENSGGYWGFSQNTNAFAGGDDDFSEPVDVAPGEIAVTASVTVSFELRDELGN